MPPHGARNRLRNGPSGSAAPPPHNPWIFSQMRITPTVSLRRPHGRSPATVYLWATRGNYAPTCPMGVRQNEAVRLLLLPCVGTASELRGIVLGGRSRLAEILEKRITLFEGRVTRAARSDSDPGRRQQNGGPSRSLPAHCIEATPNVRIAVRLPLKVPDATYAAASPSKKHPASENLCRMEPPSLTHSTSALGADLESAFPFRLSRATGPGSSALSSAALTRTSPPMAASCPSSSPSPKAKARRRPVHWPLFHAFSSAPNAAALIGFVSHRPFVWRVSDPFLSRPLLSRRKFVRNKPAIPKTHLPSRRPVAIRLILRCPIDVSPRPRSRLRVHTASVSDSTLANVASIC